MKKDIVIKILRVVVEAMIAAITAFGTSVTMTSCVMPAL